MNDSLPRPSLVHFALSTLIVGLCGAVLAFELADFFRANSSISVAIYLMALLVTQGLSSFGRAQWSAWACTVLAAIPALMIATVMINVVTDRDVPFRQELILRQSLVAGFFAVAALANGLWAMKLSKAEAKSAFIRRYSLAELATIFTILCAVAAVVAKIYRDRSNGL